MVTHCAPTAVQAIIGGSFLKPDQLTDYLQVVDKNLRYKKWFFGHYHDNRDIMGRYILLYEQIIRIA